MKKKIKEKKKVSFSETKLWSFATCNVLFLNPVIPLPHTLTILLVQPTTTSSAKNTSNRKPGFTLFVAFNYFPNRMDPTNIYMKK